MLVRARRRAGVPRPPPVSTCSATIRPSSSGHVDAIGGKRRPGAAPAPELAAPDESPSRRAEGQDRAGGGRRDQPAVVPDERRRERSRRTASCQATDAVGSACSAIERVGFDDEDAGRRRRPAAIVALAGTSQTLRRRVVEVVGDEAIAFEREISARAPLKPGGAVSALLSASVQSCRGGKERESTAAGAAARRTSSATRRRRRSGQVHYNILWCAAVAHRYNSV